LKERKSSLYVAQAHSFITSLSEEDEEYTALAWRNNEHYCPWFALGSKLQHKQFVDAHIQRYGLNAANWYSI
jgi:hypothetical protein